ncbi:hypothetical protein PG988_008791 [Apiospora saccharicola]
MAGWEQQGVTVARLWDWKALLSSRPRGPAAGSWTNCRRTSVRSTIWRQAGRGGLRVILHHYETETSDGGVKKRKAEELVNGGPKQ